MEKNLVIILADNDDLHALSVNQEIIKLGYRCQIINTKNFPGHVQITQRIDENSFIITIDGQNISSSEIIGVWRRRIFRHLVDKELSSPSRQISIVDTYEALLGLLLNLSSDNVYIINDPLKETSSLNKLYQLKAALKCGLRIPQTLVTNKPVDVKEFYIQNSNNRIDTIYKVFASPTDRMVPTRLFTKEDLSRLCDLKYAPTIFQEFIIGRNLRITIVDNNIFSAEVFTTSVLGNVDWRVEINNPIKKINIPISIQEKLLMLMKHLGLIYGALDLKLKENNEVVFLELNPMGQYLFVEIQTGQNISKAIAEYLCGL